MYASALRGSSNALRSLRTVSSTRPSSSISALQAAFRDPSSPFHIPPGTQGPASPDEPSSVENYSTAATHSASPQDEGRKLLTSLGYDPASFWEQTIVWGDHDSFQHVNNVKYVRYFESGRIHWMISLAEELGGPEKVRAMLNAQGTSLILKSISVDFKKPVVFPDTLLIAHKPYYPPNKPASPTHFNCLAVAYSYAQRAIVTTSDSVLVWYDYDNLRKTKPGEQALAVLKRRMDLGNESQQA
ncbi:hypothetical protein HGRIS_005063 [Hohenbuehelia grisea]|uniref:Thioesterase/thiol ester dehydrase-isomerase n=1 Tax=Hohenbuehelia grisea TaxID=104357 RepID=A0ABR3JE25_9AGAR